MLWRIQLNGSAMDERGKLFPLMTILHDPGGLEALPRVLRKAMAGEYWEDRKPLHPIKCVNLVMTMRELEAHQLPTFLPVYEETSTPPPQTMTKPEEDIPLFTSSSAKGRTSTGKPVKGRRCRSGPKVASTE